MNLPRGHLSPSQVDQYHRCGIQYEIFTVGGARRPPDFVLDGVKTTTHETILETDLGQKIESGQNLSDAHLVDDFRVRLEKKAPDFTGDPNLPETPLEKLIEAEISYFGKIATETSAWRGAIVPKAVEERLEGFVGIIPVVGYLDIREKNRIRDLKRRNKKPSKGGAARSLQLATYALLTGIADVAVDTIVENKKPTIEPDLGTIEPGQIDRVKVIYEKTALSISAGIFMPVDISDPRKTWICSAQYCGAWRREATDWKTGRDISCKYGEKAAVTVYQAGGEE